MIGFNKPYHTGKELAYIKQAIRLEKLSGNGHFTQKCQAFFEKRYHFKKTLLTQSCTAALEMAALLCDVKIGDEVILPSYTFVSTANAFALRGAKLVFADSSEENPNISVQSIQKLITKKTKVVVVVHYAGIACDMDAVMKLAKKNNLLVVEDAAQAIDSFYKKKPLGSIGHLAAFSFHETKNIISGEGGMLVINDERFIKRAEIIWEKGTNRSAFFRGEVDKYSWVDIGSSFLPSEITAAFLWAQLEKLNKIQKKRKKIWVSYFKQLNILQKEKLVKLPVLPSYASNNAHLFYLLVRSHEEQIELLNHLRLQEIQAIFHYLPLHRSPYYSKNRKVKSLPEAECYGSTLIRLPLYFELTQDQVREVVKAIKSFYSMTSI
jgi:dTDP-4-amino-4,6-dideoxygalactose transaminase